MKSFHQTVIQITEDNNSDNRRRIIALFGAAERQSEHENMQTVNSDAFIVHYSPSIQ